MGQTEIKYEISIKTKSLRIIKKG